MSDGNEKRQPILLIEDDEATRSVIVEGLEALGCDDVSALGGGAHAVKVLDMYPGSQPIAIIDIFLTGRTAKHLAGGFRQDHGIQKLSILSSGTADDLAAARSVFEKRGIPVVYTNKKPATWEMLQRFLG